jgi:hypothetical protein
MFLMHIFQKISSFEISQLFTADLPTNLDPTFNKLDFNGYLNIKCKCDLSTKTFFLPYVGLTSEWDDANQDGNIKVIFDLNSIQNNVLPHMALMERVGSRLKNLQLATHVRSLFADDKSEFGTWKLVTSWSIFSTIAQYWKIYL